GHAKVAGGVGDRAHEHVADVGFDGDAGGWLAAVGVDDAAFENRAPTRREVGDQPRVGVLAERRSLPAVLLRRLRQRQPLGGLLAGWGPARSPRALAAVLTGSLGAGTRGARGAGRGGAGVRLLRRRARRVGAPAGARAGAGGRWGSRGRRGRGGRRRGWRRRLRRRGAARRVCKRLFG